MVFTNPQKVNRRKGTKKIENATLGAENYFFAKSHLFYIFAHMATLFLIRQTHRLKQVIAMYCYLIRQMKQKVFQSGLNLLISHQV